MSEESKSRTSDTAKPALNEPIQSVVDALSKLRFGTIQLTVHEGRLVQVDVTERKRFAA